MRRFASPTPLRAGVVPGICVLVILVAGSAALAAGSQTRPNSRAYDGPRCFSTVFPDVTVTLARVSGSRQPGRQTFGNNETIYLQAEEGQRVDPGQRYLLYRIEGSVRHPSTDATVGNVIYVLGELEVLDTEGLRVVARIVSTCREIEIGDRLHPLVNVAGIESLPPSQYEPAQLITPRDTDAVVVYGSSESVQSSNPLVDRREMNLRASFAAGDVVTIDQGRAHGWQVGSSVMLYASGADAAWTAAGQSEPVTVGQGTVIWLQADTAAILILEGDRDVRLGHRARLQ